ncbi:antiviral reverse transcriptase Drt3b [Chromohalobacter sp. HP20-39]|uniref:antiviral reverse transcriptase Drt3b n=1 Tax=Chromohalobacter sp. HP20-39 TaxID=3079306 RepID=UPI00294B0238|nr:antiviral reverse transcriptase Drt3b [Chromohalobacter sp. HP20-39]MDV6319467.1 antiviral reverse transcriptase Drt3b [Chromohalobacter sp. HP20-39]
MSKSRKIKLDKKDYMRAVLTDTSPSDVPIIFSNDGLYINHHKAMKNKYNGFDVVGSLYASLVSPSHKDGLNSKDKFKEQNQQSYPMKYKIIKNETSLRTLSLIHPRSQKNYCMIYKDYADAITYLCGVGSFSIRRPVKVGSSFYDVDDKSINKYKEVNIETIEEDLKRKHASSFFSYGGFDRLYKFFNSTRYFDLEKRFPQMWVVDVANCFDTIYTHTISWAVKNKGFVKSYVRYGNQFCQRIDTVMQRSNNNETNGVPVGAEFSRVFSEILFQDIDLNIEKDLEDKKEIFLGSDYEVVRYVDDYLIFAKNKNIAKKVYDAIEDNLSDYNLYLSESKTEKICRPFFTYKSRVVVGVNDAIAGLEDTLFYKKESHGKSLVVPSKISRADKFEQYFINKIKVIMGNEGVGYSEVSPYVVGVLYKRVLLLVESYGRYTKEEKKDHELSIKVRDAFIIIMRLVFFFYSVSPSVSASEKVAKSIVVIDQFLQENLEKHLSAYRSVIMANVERLKFDREKNDDRNGYISLERLNIVIATSEFGENFAIPKSLLSFSGADPEDVTYFDIICLLYCYRDYAVFDDDRKKVVAFAADRLDRKGFDLLKDSESVHIFLDLICCPFVEKDVKKELLKKYMSRYEKSLDVASIDFDEVFDQLSQTYWFVKWKGLDLIKALERKELKRPY